MLSISAWSAEIGCQLFSLYEDHIFKACFNSEATVVFMVTMHDHVASISMVSTADGSYLRAVSIPNEPGYSLMNDGHCDAGQRPK